MQNMTPNHAQSQAGFTPPGQASLDQEPPFHADTNAAQPGNQHPLFYTRDQDDERVDPREQSSPFVLPFQSSAGMSTLTQAQGFQGATGTPPGTPPAASMSPRSLRTIRILLIVGVVLTAVIGASLFVFAQSIPSPHSAQPNKTQGISTMGASTAKPTRRVAAATRTTPSGSRSKGAGNGSLNPQLGVPGTSSAGSIPSTQALSQLGWTQAGLSEGDAIEALRTGATFTDREMSYDYRNIGTPVHHGGTLTAAAFLLTPGGLVRFAHNDVRVINNVLYDKISTGKMIQQVVNTQPSLVQFQAAQVQGQSRQFAWVNVAFELFQSKLDPATGQRQESLELDPATRQPIIHHMVVVVVRVPPQAQGANAPMGGTGWLVNTYELEPAALPTVVTDPSL